MAGVPAAGSPPSVASLPRSSSGSDSLALAGLLRLPSAGHVRAMWLKTEHVCMCAAWSDVNDACFVRRCVAQPAEAAEQGVRNDN